MLRVVLVMCAVLFGWSSICWAAHPAERFIPRENTSLGGATPEDNINDLTFLGLDERPQASQLTALENYMLAGADDPATSQMALLPWYLDVATAAGRIYDATGKLPAVLDDTALRSIPGWEQVGEEELALYRNPLTGNWPRLDAVEPSPGDLYLRPLTEVEKQWLASRHLAYQKCWYEGLGFDSAAYESGLAYEDCFTKSERLVGQVYYLRMYGWNQTLLTTLPYQVESN